MKQNIKSVLASFFFLSLGGFLFSFSGKKGGDSFEIFVNGHLVVQHYVAFTKGVQSLQLGQSFPNEKIEVYYSHCGKTGKSRTISIRNEQHDILKQWSFADAEGKSPMTCQVKDILALQKNGSAKLSLYYSSKEIPEGRLLAVIARAEQQSRTK
jgi:hypothetical protein